MPNPNPSERNNAPNFGTFGVAVRIVFLAELIAIVITVGRNPVFDEHAWQDLNLLSAFALAISFCGVAALTLASPIMRRMSLAWSSVIAFFLLVLVAVFGTDFIIFALYDIGLIDQRFPPWRDSLIIRSVIVTALISIPALRYLLLAYRIEADAKSKQEATMQALQSRIRPHFLFNSLNSVASLTRTDPDKAEAVLHDIADLFRVLLADARKLVPISAEREISRQYLEVEKIRLGDRLKVKWNVSNVPRSALMPTLILQPLLENSIYHGIEPRFNGGTISIDMWTEGDTLNIMITNPLPENPSASHGRGNKIAQENIRQRLQTQFGNAANMQAFQEGGQYHVKLRMPIVAQG
jgi:two-component system sensor histidine kinase AlgZ